LLIYPGINLPSCRSFFIIAWSGRAGANGKKCIPIDGILDFFLTKEIYRNREEPAEVYSSVGSVCSAFGPAYLCSNNKLIYMMYLNVMKEEVE
jgi:hypothetical protein